MPNRVGLRGQPCRTPNPSCARSTRAARYLHAHVSAIIQRLDAGQHLAMNALALQCGPQQWVLYAIIGLLKVYKSCKQGLLLRFGPVNEMAQGEQLVLCGEAWTKASLAGRTQAVGLGPMRLLWMAAYNLQSGSPTAMGQQTKHSCEFSIKKPIAELFKILKTFSGEPCTSLICSTSVYSPSPASLSFLIAGIRILIMT